MVPWTRSATSIVRDLFKQHRYLKAQDIWRLGTAGERPILQEQIAIDQHGRIRMKKVSNIREGKRVWIPPPQKTLPDHPFQSKRFLKDNILASLAAQNLLHNAAVSVPITTKEKLLEAERAAARRFRRMMHEAKKLRGVMPTEPPPPKTTYREWYWALGPEPPQPFEPVPPDEPLTEQEVASKMDDEKWRQAEKLEVAFHQARELEEELIAARKEARAKRFKEEREAYRKQRDEDRQLGRDGAIAQEKRRAIAIASIERYAEETGEDVSAWYEEIEGVELPNAYPGPIPDFRPKDTAKIDGRVRLTPVPPRRKESKMEHLRRKK